jgi:hypothetical protein
MAMVMARETAKVTETETVKVMAKEKVTELARAMGLETPAHPAH